MESTKLNKQEKEKQNEMRPATIFFDDFFPIVIRHVKLI